MIFSADLDYSSAQFDFPFSRTQRKHLFNISIIDDEILDISENETFSVIMTAANNTANVKLPTSQINLTITDNDGNCF